MEIVPMQLQHIPRLIQMGKEMHEESPNYRGIFYDETRLESLAKDILEHESYLAIVAKQQGEILGFFVGYIDQFYFSYQRMAQDLLLFVPQRHRGGYVAVGLIKRFEDWAINKGVVRINLAVTTGISPEKTAGLYNRMGYRQAGYLTSKEI